MFYFQYEIDINDFKKTHFFQSSDHNETESLSYRKVSFENLLVFDFDSTLFRSPLPNPKLWSSKLIGKLISDCWWFNDERTLSAPYIPFIPSNDWWNPDVVAKVDAALKNPMNLVILLTGRNRGKFGERIKELCKMKKDPDIAFHLLLCKELKSLPESGVVKEYMSTFDFKIGVLTEILCQFPSISRIVIYDDRHNHIKLFSEKLDEWKNSSKITDFEMNLVTDMDSTMPHDLETQLVLDLIKTYNDRIFTCTEKPELSVELTKLSIEATSCDDVSKSKARKNTISSFRNPIELVDKIEYCAIFLDNESRDLLQTKFSQPPGWKVKCDHMTVSFGKLNESLVAEMGGLGTKHTIIATHFGIYRDTCVAVKLDSTRLRSENETMHITLYISQNGSARQSNLITEWQRLPEPITLMGTLNVKKVTGIKTEPPPPIVKSEVSIGQLVIKYHPRLKGKEIGIMVDFVKRWMSQQLFVNLKGNRANIEYFVSTTNFSQIVAEQTND